MVFFRLEGGLADAEIETPQMKNGMLSFRFKKAARRIQLAQAPSTLSLMSPLRASQIPAKHAGYLNRNTPS